MRRTQLVIGLGWLTAMGLPVACSSNGSSPTEGSGGSPPTTGSGVNAGAGATGNSGGSSAQASTGAGGVVITPSDPGAHDVLFAVDSTSNTHPISRYIYGTNQGNLKTEAKGVKLTRVGGNRMTAYNWETNASNAGSDYLFQNDAFISSSKVAGDPMRQACQTASDAAASIIMTVPIAGWVSADESGPCNAHPSGDAEIAQRFFPLLAKKNAAFAYPPDTTDKKVYADEFVAWLESQFPNAQTDAARRIFYMLDNEPDLWSNTHSEIHPKALTYAELVQKNVDFARAIRDVVPKAIIFGSVNYGWAGYVDLQGAPDANKRDWLDFYLDSMKAAEQSSGKRLVDVLDVHWYPEAQGDGKRITDEGTSAGEVDARLAAPRSLWDPSYTETSWITQFSTMGPINLLPRLRQKVDAHYPGTKLSISEYNYGAGGDISGGIAQADVLGVFGRENLFAATTWLLGPTNNYLFAGFAMFVNYDGSGGAFGDTSIDATTSSVDKSSVYASVSSTSGSNVTVVAINKGTSPLAAGITVKHTASLKVADVYALTSAAPSPQKGAALTAVATNAFLYTMPPRSVTTLVFHP